MKIIIPMAGKGSRLRPHTLTVPKPLIPVAGKPIVQRLVEDLAASYKGNIDEIAFIIGDFGDEAEQNLHQVAQSVGARSSIYYQQQPLGTAHAILCAAPSLSGPLIVAFADTLFRADFTFDPSLDGIIWTQRVPDPVAYGVVKLHPQHGYITDFVEKPREFVSDMAIVGIYYFKDGQYLHDELKYLLDNNIKEKGEYQLTNALENMKRKGSRFFPGEITEWLDCGNKDAVVHSNQRMLQFHAHTDLIAPSAVITNSTIIPPCYIGEGATIQNSIIGPFTSIGSHSHIQHALITNSILQPHAKVTNAILHNSMLGSHAEHIGHPAEVSIGDYTKQKI
jgi:glucose-1-phosphate thymidylyltransferase